MVHHCIRIFVVILLIPSAGVTQPDSHHLPTTSTTNPTTVLCLIPKPKRHQWQTLDSAQCFTFVRKKWQKGWLETTLDTLRADPDTLILTIHHSQQRQWTIQHQIYLADSLLIRWRAQPPHRAFRTLHRWLNQQGNQGYLQGQLTLHKLTTTRTTITCTWQWTPGKIWYWDSIQVRWNPNHGWPTILSATAGIIPGQPARLKTLQRITQALTALPLKETQVHWRVQPNTLQAIIHAKPMHTRLWQILLHISQNANTPPTLQGFLAFRHDNLMGRWIRMELQWTQRPAQSLLFAALHIPYILIWSPYHQHAAWAMRLPINAYTELRFQRQDTSYLHVEWSIIPSYRIHNSWEIGMGWWRAQSFLRTDTPPYIQTNGIIFLIQGFRKAKPLWLMDDFTFQIRIVASEQTLTSSPPNNNNDNNNPPVQKRPAAWLAIHSAYHYLFNPSTYFATAIEGLWILQSDTIFWRYTRLRWQETFQLSALLPADVNSPGWTLSAIEVGRLWSTLRIGVGLGAGIFQEQQSPKTPSTWTIRPAAFAYLRLRSVQGKLLLDMRTGPGKIAGYAGWQWRIALRTALTGS